MKKDAYEEMFLKGQSNKPITPDEIDETYTWDTMKKGSDPIEQVSQNGRVRQAQMHKDLMEKLEKSREKFMSEAMKSSKKKSTRTRRDPDKLLRDFSGVHGPTETKRHESSAQAWSPNWNMATKSYDSNDSTTSYSVKYKDRHESPQRPPSPYFIPDTDDISDEEFDEVYRGVEEELDNNPQNMAKQNSPNIIKLLTDPKYLNNNILVILKNKGYVNILTLKFLIAISRKRTNEASIYLINIIMHKLSSHSLSQLFPQMQSRYSSRLEIIKNNSKTENSYNHNPQTLEFLKEILNDFCYRGLADFIREEFINKIPLEVSSSKNISKLEEEYQIDLTSLFTLDDDVLNPLAMKGLFLYIKGKFSNTDSNKEFTIKSQSVLRTIYYKSIHMGFTVDPIINFLLVINPVNFDRLQIHISLYANHDLKQLLILYVKLGNRSLILKSGNIKKSTNYDTEQVLEYLSWAIKSEEAPLKEYITLGEHKISKSLFEEATECNIDELIANLQFEESL